MRRAWPRLIPGDRAVRQAQLNSPPEAPHPLLHQLVHPCNHGVDPSRAEHDQRDPIANVDPRGLAGLMRCSQDLHVVRRTLIVR